MRCTDSDCINEGKQRVFEHTFGLVAGLAAVRTAALAVALAAEGKQESVEGERERTRRGL